MKKSNNHGRARFDTTFVQAALSIIHKTHLVDELMGVDLEPEGRVEDAQAAEDSEKVVVAPEKHVQPHLDVVAVLVLPTSHLEEQLEDVRGVGYGGVPRTGSQQ